MSASPVSPGDVLLGKYRVDRLLGVGGMGVVVAATHLLLGERVAIKFMLPGKGPQDEQWQRFVNEGRACARLKTAHVARVIDVGDRRRRRPHLPDGRLRGERHRWRGVRSRQYVAGDGRRLCGRDRHIGGAPLVRRLRLQWRADRDCHRPRQRG
jgi:hypothetical protein